MPRRSRATRPYAPARHVPVCFPLSAFIAVLSLLALSCRQDMHDAPSYDAYEKSAFFADNRSSRPQVAGTVARGQLREDAVFYTGRQGEAFVDAIPLTLDEATLRRGRERYEIYCTPCHGHSGYGDGIVVRRGYRGPASFHVERMRAQPAGYFYDVITNGFGAMPDYAAQITPKDRWAIVAYLGALQLSQNATLADVPAEHRAELDAAGAAPTHAMPRPETGLAPADPRYGAGASPLPRREHQP